MNTDADTLRGLEIKVERHWTGNLFLEAWSNRNLEDRTAPRARLYAGLAGHRRADLLLLYFLNTDDLITVSMLRLKHWAFGSGPQGGIYTWPEKQRGRFAQPNNTWGRWVPVEHLEREVGAKRSHVRQMDLLKAWLFLSNQEDRKRTLT